MDTEEESTFFLSLDKYERIYIEDYEGETSEYPFWAIEIHIGPNKTYFKR